MSAARRFAVLCAAVSLTAFAEERRYREGVDGKASTTTVTTEPGRTVVQYPDDRYDVRSNAEGAASSVEITLGTSGAKVHVTRTRDVLTLKRGTTTASERIDASPWHQSPFQLHGFVTSGEKERAFWVVTTSSDDGAAEVLKLIAKREGAERKSINGVTQDTVHVVLTLPGFRSLFWKAHYWFRPDGTLLRYEEPRGKDGLVVGQLTGSAAGTPPPAP